jgi:hypothetical protein
MARGYGEFEFDLPSALLASLVRVFDKMKAAPLTTKSIDSVPNEQGVYQLFWRTATT